MIENFDLFCEEKKYNDEKKKFINNIRESEPARRVRSNSKNVPGFYSSKKMGMTIQFESHTLELCAIYLMEFDNNVYEFYDQPPSFKINYMKNGRNVGHNYTPDFFVISDDFVGWEEWKTDEELSKLIEKSPERYILDEEGRWRCPPAEEYATEKGLSFRVRSSTEVDWTFQNNIRFLEDYLLEETPTVSLTNRNIILNYVRSTLNITLEDLLSVKEAAYTSDDIYKLIILGEIYVDLNRFLIINFDKFPLFINQETANAVLNARTSGDNLPSVDISNLVDIEVGKNILWNGNLWRVINLGETEITLLDEMDNISPLSLNAFEELIKMGAIESLENKSNEKGEDSDFIEIIKSANPEELAEANAKYFKLKQHLDGEPVDVPPRTLRHWKKKYLKAQKEYGRGYLGLIPKRHKQGNRRRKMNDSVIKLIKEFISNNYENNKQSSKSSVYNRFKQQCIEEGFDPPSSKTFHKEIEKRSKYEQDLKRSGPKAAYDKEPVHWELSLTTPRHGSRPFELAHIDHTKLDIELLCSKTNKNLGRPWLTLLIDAYSRRILSFHLTYDEPSYRSCMSTIRECVRKYSRLPKTLIVDGGKEFQSTYFDSLLGIYNCHKKRRPGGKPKFGSVCERLFGTANTNFIYTLQGNTQITKNVRQITPDFNPKKLAVWTLEDLYEMLYQWLYEKYDKDVHLSLNQSPREAYQQNIKKTGERKQTFIRYDQNFEMLTFPTTKKGTAKVQPGQGIKINNVYYNSYELLNPLVEGKQIPVRYDPFDYSKAYAYVGNYWTTLHSQYELEFEGRTEKEIKIATAEIRKRKRESQKEKTNSVTAAELARFLEEAEAHELLEIQRLKDEALKNSLRVIQGGKSSKSNDKGEMSEKEDLKQNRNRNSLTNSERVNENKKSSEYEMYGEFF